MPYAPNKPETVTHIVMSVPHSGTRTLQSYLAEHRPQTVPENWDTVGAWHFDYHPHYITKFLMYAKHDPTRRAYVPVRNPLDVADSWERRYKDDGAHNGWNMCNAVGQMVDAYLNYPEHIELFKMEALPVLRGHGPVPEDWQRLSPDHPRIAELRSFMARVPEVEDFYRGMYTPEELWWL